jgi:hypothetical protein
VVFAIVLLSVILVASTAAVTYAVLSAKGKIGSSGTTFWPKTSDDTLLIVKASWLGTDRYEDPSKMEDWEVTVTDEIGHISNPSLREILVAGGAVAEGR